MAYYGGIPKPLVWSTGDKSFGVLPMYLYINTLGVTSIFLPGSKNGLFRQEHWISYAQPMTRSYDNRFSFEFGSHSKLVRHTVVYGTAAKAFKLSLQNIFLEMTRIWPQKPPEAEGGPGWIEAR